MAMTHKPRHDAGSDTMQIGLGWHILNNKIIWHNGGTGGFRSFAGFDPQTQTCVVVLTNSNTGADDLRFYPRLCIREIESSVFMADDIEQTV